MKTKLRSIVLYRYFSPLLFVMCFVFSFGGYAQQKTVSGAVTDQEGVPLPGVNVIVKGTNRGTTTDFDGNYTINAAPGEILLYTYVGQRTEERTVETSAVINVRMSEDAQALEEVVVIGYGEVERKDLTGSVSSVSNAQIRDIPLSSAAEAITGRLAGVKVTSTEGRPGADIEITVRGGTSITQDNTPLYIVDGVQMDNALSILSMQEIETIDVLKDAASTAIYGARGANGVILITTKGGKAMPTQITYNTFAGVREITNKLEVMKPYDFVLYQYQVYDGSEEDRNNFIERYGRWEDLDIYKSMPYTDWQEEVFGRAAWSQTHVLTATGGSEKTTFSLNLNHVEEDGIMLNSANKRSLMAFKFTHNASDRLKIGVNTRYSRQRIDGVGTSSTGSQGTNRLRNSVRYRPFSMGEQENEVDVFDPEYANLTNLTNPVLLANNEIRNDYRTNFNLNGWLQLELMKGLSFRSVAGMVQNWRTDQTFNGRVTGVARQNADMPVVQLRKSESLTLNFSNTLNYKTTLGNHKMDFLLGTEFLQGEGNSHNSTIKWFPEDITAKEAFAGIQKATPPEGQIQDAPTTGESIHRLLSFFGRINYSYAGKYLATFTLRADGSSKFMSGNRYAYFPSGALSWRISEESFLENADFLSNLKLRVSMGLAGNNRIDNDLYKTMFSASGDYGYAFGDAVTPGFASTSLANPFLKWETTVSSNAGVDFSFFDNRLSGSVDAYLNRTRDLLLNKDIPQTSGYSRQIQNVGKTENRGLEFQLSGDIIRTRDFSWTANFNIAFNKNKIVSLGNDPQGNPQQYFLQGSGWVNNMLDFKVEVGKPLGQFYGFITDGFYGIDDFNYDASTQTYTLKEGVPSSSAAALGAKGVQPGDLKLVDLNGDGVIGEEDRTVLGNAQPKHFGGFNQQFIYKNFDMSVFINWSYGNKVYNANKMEYTTAYLYKDNNMLSIMTDRWKWYDANGVKVTDPQALAEMNKDTKYWTPPGGYYTLHSAAIEDGSFLRISNITLGYTLPEEIVRKTGFLSNIRVYATVNNVWTITGYSGYDPEANTRRSTPLTPGVDYSAYPRSRYVLTGINVTF